MGRTSQKYRFNDSLRIFLQAMNQIRQAHYVDDDEVYRAQMHSTHFLNKSTCRIIETTSCGMIQESIAHEYQLPTLFEV